jgi:hypothetical protein
MPEPNEGKKEKCFVIMPISDQGDYPQGHFTKVYEQIIKPSVEGSGYEAYRVDENNICDAIINKIFTAIQECPMAICDLSNRNPNVLYELGLRQAYDKPVVLIQDEKTEKIFDISGISTVFYKSTRLYEDVLEARESIKKAILSTKEGKSNTLAKVIKVKTADFSQVEVSQDDKTNIILEDIYKEIRELKTAEQDCHTIMPTSLDNHRRYYLKLRLKCADSETINILKNKFFKGRCENEYIYYNEFEDGAFEAVIENIKGTEIDERTRFYIKIAKILNAEILHHSYYPQ